MTDADFCAMFDPYRARLVAVVRAVMNEYRCRDEDAEDVVQDAYLKAYRLRDRYDMRRMPPYDWMAFIARHVAIDYSRKSTRRRCAVRAFADREARGNRDARGRDLVCVEGVGDDAYLEANTDILAALLVYRDGYATADVACILGIKTTRARLLTRKGLERLRLMCASGGEGGEL